jgi:hypothetical protein
MIRDAAFRIAIRNGIQMKRQSTIDAEATIAYEASQFNLK